MNDTVSTEALVEKFDKLQATIGIIGLGYVGLPLALAACTAKYKVIGFDIDGSKVDQINRGQSYIKHIGGEELTKHIKSGHLRCTADFTELAKADAILICVPTPLTRHREPDLHFVEATARTIAKHLRRGQLIVLESTTYPGTTTDVVKPILDATGLVCGRDYFLAFSPEREDPGNKDFSTGTIPKVVGGEGADALKLTSILYGKLTQKIVTVSTTATAEAVKLTENIFRAVNIALVNELKIIYDAMGIDVWEVIDAAKSKPFGYMAFYPGPGIGGHCIPVDPFYLTWKAREYEISTHFIELAGEINSVMPKWVVDRLSLALDQRFQRGLTGAKILLVGLAYKRNVDDLRESPSLKLIELMQARGAKVDYYDPFIPVVPPLREHAGLVGWRSVDWSKDTLAGYDAAIIATDHDDVDYAALASHSRLVVDCHNACARHGIKGDNIIRA
jgi:UDP-N-acetyl-D-glucosamine dehydrogenase